MAEKSSEIPENIDEIFAAAVDIVHNLPKEGPLSVPNKEKLKFYSLYKQATDGPCSIPRPPFWQPIERFKWDGWNSLREMDSKLAKHIYVRKMQKMIDQVYQTHDIAQLFGYVGDDAKELDAKMRPKFKLIGRELLTPEQTNAVMNSEQNVEGFTEVANIFPPKKVDDTVSSLSDDEYADAWEAPVPTAPVLDKQRHSRVHHPCTLDSQVQVLTDQVKQLSQSLLEQSKLLNQLMREIIALRRQQGIGGLSWSMFALIILWPFFVKHVFNYLIRTVLNLVS